MTLDDLARAADTDTPPGLARATFVHRTAYDEMIGVPSASGSADFREIVDLQTAAG